MADAIPNITFRNWRAQHHLSRAELADRINATDRGRRPADLRRGTRPALGKRRSPLAVTPYRRALKEATGLDPDQLGFISRGQAASSGRQLPHRRRRSVPQRGRADSTPWTWRGWSPSPTSAREHSTRSRRPPTCCAAPTRAPRGRAASPHQAAAQLHRPAAGGRLTLAQHRELLVTTGWLALLLGCVHYDLGEREPAEAARQAAYQAGLQAGHGEIIAWSYEMAAWFALTEGRYHDVVDYAQAGQQHAGLTNAMVQLVLQQARGQPASANATTFTPA